MWMYKLICVFILATATVNAAACLFWSSWSACNRSCGGGVQTRTCGIGGTQSQSCNQFCYNGNPYIGGCRCSVWRSGYCCERCLDTGIVNCKPGKFQCGGSPDGIRCTDCYLPYKPAGFNKGCVRKPCSENNGGCSYLCTGVGGLTTCTCRAGYQLSSDEYSCTDINECMTGIARCKQQCINTNGSFRCACDIGYRLKPDGFTCDDIDECGAGVSKCSQICINTNGTYHCECEKGFHLGTDTITCINERYYESSSTTSANVTCTLGEPQLKYHNTLFEVNETLSNIDDVWIGYIYAKVPFLLVGCASLQSGNGVEVKNIADCFTVCRDGKFGIKRTGHGPLGLLCICVMGSFDTIETSCKGGAQSSLCNNCSEIYTQINVNASTVDGPDAKPDEDCLTVNYLHFKWQNCSKTDYIRPMCSNANYTDLTATAMIEDTYTGNWSAGNKLCLTNGRHPSFVRSITNTGFTEVQTQYYWTGIFRANVLIKRSLKDVISRFSNDSYVYLIRGSKLLYLSNNIDKKRALCITGSESTSRQPETSKYTTKVTTSITPSTYSKTNLFLTNVTTPDVTTTDDTSRSVPTTQMYTTEHLETTEYTTEVTPSITPSTYSETSVFLTKVTTPDVTTTYGSTSSLSTAQIYTTLTTDDTLSVSNDGIIENSRQPNSKKSPAVAVDISVSVGILFLVGGAVVILLKRRGMLHCNRKTRNNKSSGNETLFKENMTYGKSNEDNVANHNYFILEKYGQSISSNAEHYNESKIEEDYNTIYEKEEPYEHVKVENCDYDHTTNALKPEYDARITENVYNKLRIVRPDGNGHDKRDGPNFAHVSEDDYDTTSAVVTKGKDDVSDYNHIPYAANEAGSTGEEIKVDKCDAYEAINVIKYKVAQYDDSDYAHVNKTRIK